MKTLPTVTAFAFGVAVLVTSLGQEEDTINYPIRDIDQSSAKFDRLYNSVADAEKKRIEEIRKKEEPQPSRYKFLQNLGGGKYLVKHSATEVDYLLNLATHHDKITDGETLLIKTEKSREVYKYKTVLGATRTIGIIRVYTPPPPVKRITKTMFVEKIKRGAHYDLEIKTGTRTCTTCGGNGQFTDGPVRAGQLSKTISCGTCNGQKKEPVYKWYRIRW